MQKKVAHDFRYDRRRSWKSAVKAIRNKEMVSSKTARMLPVRKRWNYSKRRRKLLSRTHTHINDEKKKQLCLRANKKKPPGTQQTKRGVFVANAQPYRRVVISSVRGSVTRRIKWQLNFDILMMPNTCQVTDEDAEYVFYTGLFLEDSGGENWIRYSISWKLSHSLWASSEVLVCAMFKELRKILKVVILCCCWYFRLSFGV